MKTINPLWFMDEGSTGGSCPVPIQPLASLQNPVLMMGGCVPSEYMNSPEYQYGGKLYYDVEKAQIDVVKNQTILAQRLEYEQKKEKMKIQICALKDMCHFEVYPDSLGRIFYSQIGIDDEKLHSKILFNAMNYTANCLLSFYPEVCVVLEVRWENCGKGIYFEYTDEGISTQKFLKKLKARGILFRVSRRNEKAVAEALLSYTLNTAKKYEIPFCRGWNLMESGKWHFAERDEMTMKEVLDHVR